MNPNVDAAEEVSPVKLSTSLGKMGMISPMPRISSTRVMKMNLIAGLRVVTSVAVAGEVARLKPQRVETESLRAER